MLILKCLELSTLTDSPGGQERYWRTDGIQAGQVFEELAWWPVMENDLDGLAEPRDRGSG